MGRIESVRAKSNRVDSVQSYIRHKTDWLLCSNPFRIDNRPGGAAAAPVIVSGTVSWPPRAYSGVCPDRHP